MEIYSQPAMSLATLKADSCLFHPLGFDSLTAGYLTPEVMEEAGWDGVSANYFRYALSPPFGRISI